MTKRTMELILQVPFIETFLVKDVETFEVSDLVISVDGFEADGTTYLVYTT